VQNSFIGEQSFWFYFKTYILNKHKIWGNKQYLGVAAFKYHFVATGLHCCRHKRMQ